MGRMRVVVHAEITDALLAEWAELFARDPEATPFSSPGWAKVWWSRRGAGARLFVLAVRDGETLVGLAPLVLRRTGPFRVVRPFADDLADYWEVLAAPASRAGVVEAIAREIRRRAGEWDVFLLKRLPPASATPAAFAAAGLRLQAQPTSPYPAIELPSSFDAYLGSLPTERRTNLRRRLRHLDEGELTLHEITDRESIPEAIDRWHQIRNDQWSSRGRELAPLHRTDEFRDFLREIALELVPRGLCLLWEFHRGAEVVGSFLNLADDRAFYAYMGGYRADAGRLGIGKIATAEAIRRSISSGRRRYDFLEGAESYKYWYGAEDRRSEAHIAMSGRPRSRAAVALGTALHRLR